MSQLTDFNAVLDDLAALLAEIAPTRLVTRDLKDWSQHAPAARAGGVFTILPGPRTGYGYEYRPGDLPRVQIFIFGERLLSEKAPGRAVDTEENAMARDIERLAERAPETPGLEEITLQSITPAAQTMAPTASVLAVLIYGVDR